MCITRIVRVFLPLCLALAAAAAPAADWPTRPVRFITPALPGGTTDTLSRIFAARMTETLGTQVIVDNRGSASGVLGAEITKAAAPDGYTLFMAYHQHTVNAAMMKLPYHPVNDFTPITQLTEAGLVLVVNPSAPPDGYTLLLAYHQHTVNAALNPNLPYHPVDSFTPITQLTSAGLMLVVNPSSPANNLAEFIAWTKNF